MAGRALVLGSGGIAGVGWLCGMLHGLAEAGVGLDDADTVIGTSAGAIVGAQLTSGKLTPAALYERQLAPHGHELGGTLGAGLLLRFARAALTSRTIEAYGRALGRFALAAPTPKEAARRAVIAGRLLSHDWPERRLLITAVQARTGEFRVFDGEEGAALVDAVAASCAVPGVWPPVTIGGARWIDGGMRSPANAQLAEGHERVVVLAPVAVGGGVLHPARAQAARLAAAGARTILITPDRAARRAFGVNSLNPAHRAPSARAGHRQAATHAEAVRKVWTAD
ncbi:patatin-like phospholipase family protein [Streptomyces sp. NPDC016845]|uniref:patatin-like phospholipase family protein n=1 Tax=Streptomyces sp. NPDC016845 TaxID=3364972 RepID=UPI00378FFB7F